MRPSTCSRCGAAVLRARTPEGLGLVLDARPHPEGSRRLLADGVTALLVAKGSAGELYRNHHSSCPESLFGRWAPFTRKRKGKGKKV